MTGERRTAADVLDEILQAPLERPFSSRRLRRDSLHDFLQRRASAQIAIGELYHENSKLFAENGDALLAQALPPGALQSEFLRRRATTSARGPVDPPLPPHVRALLADAARERSELDYAMELRVVAGDDVVAHEPWSDRVRLVRRLSEDERRLLLEGLAAFRPGPRGSAALVFVVASFARNEVLYGARGYRRTLLEAGQVVRRLVTATEAAGLATEVVYDYADYDVDAALGVDGVEEGCVAAIFVEDDGGH